MSLREQLVWLVGFAFLSGASLTTSIASWAAHKWVLMVIFLAVFGLSGFMGLSMALAFCDEIGLAENERK